MTNSEMSLLGDRWVGSAGPLCLRFEVTDVSTTLRDKGRRARSDEEVFAIRIERADLYCGTRRLEDAAARAVAGYLMMHGSWQEETKLLRDDAGRVTAVAFEFAPDPELADGHALPVFTGGEALCALHGHLSGMMSHEFLERTTRPREGSGVQVTALRLDPAARLGCQLPESVLGFELPLMVATAIGRDQTEPPVDDRSA